MDVFFANGDRYNLLNSAVLEMVEFIRKENLKVGRDRAFREAGLEDGATPSCAQWPGSCMVGRGSCLAAA